MTNRGGDDKKPNKAQDGGARRAIGCYHHLLCSSSTLAYTGGTPWYILIAGAGSVHIYLSQGAKNMYDKDKIISYTTIAIAVILALFASFLSPERLGAIMFAVKFFEVMIPVLAVGALIKYLFSYHSK